MTRILMVDDQPDILNLGKEFLEMETGFSIETTNSALHALYLLTAHPYDGIISDYVMPEMNGLEFLTQIKTVNPDIPFIFFTGQEGEEVVIEALNKGADYYVKKGGNSGHNFYELARITKILISRDQSVRHLKENQERFRILTDAIPIGILMYQGNRWVYVNPAAGIISGYSRKELLSMQFWEILHPDYQEMICKLAQMRLTPESIPPKHLQVAIIRKDGEERWIDLTAHTLRVGNENAGLITATDITERWKLEQKLTLSEEKYRSIFENQIDLYYQTSMDGIITELSPSCEQLSGYHPRDLIGHPVLELYADPGQKTGLMELLGQDGTVYDFETLLKSANGTLVPVSINCHIIADQEGKPVRIEGSIRNITDRKEAEEALRLSEEHYRSLFENMQEGFTYCRMIYDEAGEPVDWIHIKVNQAFKRMANIRDIAGKRVSELFSTTRETNQEVFDRLSQVVATGEPCRFENNFSPLDLWFAISAYRPEPGHFVSIFEDITERKRAEMAMQALITENQTILENVPSMIWYKDREHRFIRVNPAAARVFGRSIAEIEGKTFTEIFPGRPDRFHADDDTVIITGIPMLGVQERLITSEGEHLCLQTDKVPLRDQNGSIIGILIVSSDITEREKAKEAISRANKKLNLLSEITRHDVGNQLQGLFLALDLAANPDTPQQAEKFITRAQTITHNIARQMAFTRDYQDIGMKSPVWQDVPRLIQFVAGTIPDSLVHILIELPSVRIYADPLLEKVFHNLIDNALQYGKKITWIKFSGEEGVNRYTIICADDGVGIPTDYKTKIFNREYFTHTGFGLNLSRDILEITGITIRETGTEGVGARFEITVPPENYRLSLDKTDHMPA